MLKNLIFAVFAVTGMVAGATDYYLLSGTEIGYTSSISGNAGEGTFVGWSTTIDGPKAINSMNNDTSGDFYVPPPPEGKTYRYVRSGNASWMMQPTSTLTVMDDAHFHIDTKLASGGLYKLVNVTIGRNATMSFSNIADGNSLKPVIDGGYTGLEGSVLQFSEMSSPGQTRTFDFAGRLTGTGSLRFPASSGFIANQADNSVSGDITAFTGNIAVYGAGTEAVKQLLELKNPVSHPSDPAAPAMSYVIVSNSATLKIDADWMSGPRRTWIFRNDDENYAQPVINVAEGVKVVIRGPVDAPAGFCKKGAGELVICGEYPLAFRNAVTVSAGTVSWITDYICVAGEPEELDDASPDYGICTAVEEGVRKDFSCSHADCVGYRLVSEDGLTTLASGTEKSFSIVYSAAVHKGATVVWRFNRIRRLQFGVIGEGGTVSGLVNHAETAECGEYMSTNVISLTANPAEGYRFGYWAGNLPDGVQHRDSVISFDMAEDRYANAVFLPEGTKLAYLLGTDAGGTSSLDSKNGTYGWSDGTKGAAAGTTYLIDRVGANIYSPRTGTGANRTFPGDALITARGGITAKVNSGTSYTIPYLYAAGSSSIEPATSDACTLLVEGTTWTVYPGCQYTFSWFGSSVNDARNVRLTGNCRVVGTGTLVFSDRNGSGTAADGTAKKTCGTIVNWNLRDFEGRILGRFGTRANMGDNAYYDYIRFATAQSIPGAPPALDRESIHIENGGWLMFDVSAVIPHNRGMLLEAGRYPSQYYNLPTLWVASGKELVIKSPVKAPDGFRVMGGGTVILYDFADVNRAKVSCLDASGSVSGKVIFRVGSLVRVK